MSNVIATKMAAAVAADTGLDASHTQQLAELIKRGITANDVEGARRPQEDPSPRGVGQGVDETSRQNDKFRHAVLGLYAVDQTVHALRTKDAAMAARLVNQGSADGTLHDILRDLSPKQVEHLAKLLPAAGRATLASYAAYDGNKKTTLTRQARALLFNSLATDPQTQHAFAQRFPH